MIYHTKEEDQRRKAIFANIAKANGFSNKKILLSKKDLDDYNLQRVHLGKIMPSTFLYLTQAEEGIHIFSKGDVDSVAYARNRIKNKKSIEVPVLGVDIKRKAIVDHDGRHRAIGAMLEGVKQMPVIEAGVICDEHGGHCKVIPWGKLTPEQKILITKEEMLKPQTVNFNAQRWKDQVEN